MTDFLARADTTLLRAIPEVTVDLSNMVMLLMLIFLVITQFSFVISNIGEASSLNQFASRAFSSNPVQHSDSLILRDFKENIIQFQHFF